MGGPLHGKQMWLCQGGEKHWFVSYGHYEKWPKYLQYPARNTYKGSPAPDVFYLAGLSYRELMAKRGLEYTLSAYTAHRVAIAW